MSNDRRAGHLYKLFPDGEVQGRNTISRSPTSEVVTAAARRSRGRSPLQTRRHQGCQTRSAFSGPTTRRAAAACRRMIARRAPFTSSPPSRELPRRSTNLGLFYALGRGGLPKDDREAAAPSISSPQTQGHAPAQAILKKEGRTFSQPFGGKGR